MPDMLNEEQLQEKWGEILENENAGKIKDHYRKSVTAILLENQERFLKETPTNQTGAEIDNWDPILISLVRRSTPNLIAFDVLGVQPMTGPTGLIFALKSHYDSQQGDEALYDEAHTHFSGDADGTQHSGTDPTAGGYTTGDPMATSTAEDLGDGETFREMAFSIAQTSVTAQSRALKAEYSTEMSQDLKAVHGLDAETELSNILSNEIMAEINREVVRKLYAAAKPGAQKGVSSTGTFDLDTDSNGRWSEEKFKGMLFAIERDANAIAKDTRRGKGNFLITSSDVASALNMAGFLTYNPDMAHNLNVDDTGNTFAGVLNGRTRVYIDPYFSSSSNDFYMVGYKGSSPFDAGAFYAPYVPLQMVRAVGENTFQPKIGFKTRYGFVANPFTSLSADSNSYYRLVKVSNLM